MKLLLHPLLMPLLTFVFFVELERQSYTFNLMTVGLFLTSVAVFIIFFNNIFKTITQKKQSPLGDTSASFWSRIIYGIILSIIYAGHAYAIVKNIHFSLKGGQYTLIVYIIPTMLNAMSGQGLKDIIGEGKKFLLTETNLAPSGYMGALSGYIIMIGYKTGIDTFWPFVISLLILTLSLHYSTSGNNGKISQQLICYGLGLSQAAWLIYSFA